MVSGFSTWDGPQWVAVQLADLVVGEPDEELYALAEKIRIALEADLPPEGQRDRDTMPYLDPQRHAILSAAVALDRLRPEALEPTEHEE